MKWENLAIEGTSASAPCLSPLSAALAGRDAWWRPSASGYCPRATVTGASRSFGGSGGTSRLLARVAVGSCATRCGGWC
jgi:hypothetical protein